MTEARSAARALAAPGDADTIAALASPPGAGARAIVRLSGPRAHALADGVFARGECEPANQASASRRVPGAVHLEGWPSVSASLWVFDAPRSYTGEDVVEVHLPGSPPLVAALLRQLERAGARAAQPGEFTRRAFLQGRLDLTQAEAVLELTRAEADGEARAAARALLGGLRAVIDKAKDRTLDALAHVEATIDFPEEDLPGLDPAARIADRVAAVSRDLEALEARSLGRAPSSSEPVVAIAGLANAGKSTLLNALAGREAAIVSEVAGTTRDPVSVTVELAPGRRVRLVDTAGEKAATSDVERAALERTRELTLAADVLLYLVDGTSPDGLRLAGSATGDAPELGHARGRLDALAPARAALLVGTKLDLVPPGERARLESGVGSRLVLVSARTGEGLDELRRALVQALDGDPGRSPDVVQTERQSRLVARARESLERAAALLRSSEPARFELGAVDLHEALGTLGELTGALVTDDLLDKIFGEFCIGK